MKLLKRAKKGMIKNVTKVVDDGITFDSKLEHYAYVQMKKRGITFNIKPEYILIDSFRYCGELVRQMKFTPDYLLPDHNVILETKGFPNDAFPLRLKFFKYKMHKQGTEIEFVVCKTMKEVDAFLDTLVVCGL
jgi:hypothetical protein